LLAGANQALLWWSFIFEQWPLFRSFVWSFSLKNFDADFQEKEKKLDSFCEKTEIWEFFGKILFFL
jgi:hypothetical protein